MSLTEDNERKLVATAEVPSPDLQRRKRGSEDPEGPKKKPKVSSRMRSLFGSQSLPNSLPQLAFRRPGPTPPELQCLPTPNIAHDGFSGLHIDSHDCLPVMSDGGISSWPTIPSYNAYTAFWQNFNSTHGYKTATVGDCRQIQDINPKPSNDLHPPSSDIALDPGGCSRQDQSTSGSHFEFGNAALYHILDGYDIGTNTSSKDYDRDTQQVETAAEYRQGNIDPELIKGDRERSNK